MKRLAALFFLFALGACSLPTLPETTPSYLRLTPLPREAVVQGYDFPAPLMAKAIIDALGPAPGHLQNKGQTQQVRRYTYLVPGERPIQLEIETTDPNSSVLYLIGERGTAPDPVLTEDILSRLNTRLGLQ